MRQSSPREDEGSPGISDRLMAAFLAPLVFNISNLIMLAVFFRRSSPGLGRFLINDVPRLGNFLLWALVIVPALAGLLIGMNRFITLLGHLFYTNMEHEKDERITVAAWAGLLLIAYLLSLAMK